MSIKISNFKIKKGFKLLDLLKIIRKNSSMSVCESKSYLDLLLIGNNEIDEFLGHCLNISGMCSFDTECEVELSSFKRYDIEHEVIKHEAELWYSHLSKHQQSMVRELAKIFNPSLIVGG